jgi:polar amino acid transport system permease protein
VARNAASASGSLEPLFVAGLFYLVLNALLTAVFDWMGRKLDYYKG